MRLDGVDDGIGGTLLFGNVARRRVAVIAHAIAAVKPIGGGMCSCEGFLRAYKHRHLGTAELGGVQRIARGLPDIHVSSDGGDGQHLDVRRAQRHDERHRVIGSGIRIDQKLRLHAALG